MNKKIPQNIQRAITEKDLVLHQDVLSMYSAKEQKEIMKRVRYLKAAIELRKLRAKLNLSQLDLARKMDVKREFISRIESGKQNITLETLYRVAEVSGKKLHLAFQ